MDMVKKLKFNKPIFIRIRKPLLLRIVYNFMSIDRNAIVYHSLA